MFKSGQKVFYKSKNTYAHVIEAVPDDGFWIIHFGGYYWSAHERNLFASREEAKEKLSPDSSL